MRSLLTLFFIAAAVFLGSQFVQAQSKTIVLVRHAEKDTSTGADQADPVLSPAGVERAKRLVDKIKKYRVGAVYSTNYRRTRDTAEPAAQSRRKTVQIYDARKPEELIDQMMKSTTKRFLVVGHSNSTPQLVNLLAKKELFKSLDDTEYSVIWIVRMRDGNVRRVEILQY